jgi:hypothetical protein
MRCPRHISNLEPKQPRPQETSHLLSPKQQNAIMKLLASIVLAGLAASVSAAVGGRCGGRLAHPCLCLDKDICKGIGGTPTERDQAGAYPCPSDPGNIWGCYIWCD